MSRSVEGFDDVTVDVVDTEEENTDVIDELLVEDVSIDGLCGVY
jgi:mycofactocin precursor